MSVLSDVANMAECGQEMALKQYNGAIGGSIGRAPTLSENLMARKEQLEAQLSVVTHFESRGILRRPLPRGKIASCQSELARS